MTLGHDKPGRPDRRFRGFVGRGHVPPGAEVRISTGGGRASGTVELVVSGELDAVGAPSLAAVLRTVFSDRPARVVVDTSAVSFCSAAGLGVLLEVTARARNAGITFEIDPCSPSVRRVADIAEVLALLPISS